MTKVATPLYSNEKVLLRTSFFGGFEKNEVLTYIDKLREQNRTMAQELAEHICKVSAARNQLSEQVSSFEVKITEMERQLGERGGRIRELTGMVESLQNEVGQQKLRQIEREKDLQQQRDQNRQLMVQLQNYEYKAKRYEDISAQIGDIILEANQRAADTVAQAQEQAEQIKNNAVTASQKITAEMSLMRNEISTVRTQLENLMKNFNTRLDEIDNMLLEVVPAPTARLTTGRSRHPCMIRPATRRRPRDPKRRSRTFFAAPQRFEAAEQASVGGDTVFPKTAGHGVRRPSSPEALSRLIRKRLLKLL